MIEKIAFYQKRNDEEPNIRLAEKKSNERYSEGGGPVIIRHLETCRPKEVAQHAERASVCINESNKEEFKTVLINRLDSLSAPQKKRVNKILKSIKEVG